MEEILKTHANIEKGIKRNNIITIGLMVLFGLMIVVFGFSTYLIYVYLDNSRLILSADGTAQKMQRIDAEDALMIECKHHIQLLYESFYSFDQFNYRQQIDKAFWLGDRSIRELYSTKKAQNFYSRIVQNDIDVWSEIDSISVDIQSEPYPVFVKGRMYLRQGLSTKVISLDGKCNLSHVSRNFPKNPHGLFICNWEELPQSIIEDEN